MKGRTMIQMRTRVFLMMTGLYVMLAAAPASAHHAFAAQFDATKPVTLRGAVTKMEWVNPHSWIYIDLKKNDGNVEHWGIEAAGASALLSRGLTRDFLKL